MTLNEMLSRALAAYDAADNDDDGATNFVAVIVAWWVEKTPGATPADLFVGEETLVDGEGNRCFKCKCLIPAGHALCAACLQEARARARDRADDEASQRYPALA